MAISYASDAFFPVAASASSPCVSFPPSPSPLRLLIRFAEPYLPIMSDRRHLPLFSFQKRFNGDSEDISARSVENGLGIAEPVAWEFLAPLHRVLLVALVVISSSESRRSKRMRELQRSVNIRDKMLKNMQMKLDDLLTQMRFIKDHSQTTGCSFSFKNEQIIVSEMVEKNESIFFHGDSRVSHLNTANGIVPPCQSQSIKTKDVIMTEPNKEKLIKSNHEMVTEQEERRMSDLSDFCWSVASSVDSQHVQLSTLAAEQELYNLRKECEEKDATIKELTTSAHASNVNYSKRITELEEVIRRKNMIITKLKKDMLILEQQIVKFTRLRRLSSASSSSSNSTTRCLPLMTENILYDMSSTSSSSSDCDTPQKTEANHSDNSTNETFLQSVKHRRFDVAKPMGSSVSTLQRAMSSLKENRASRKVEPNVTSSRQLVSSIADQKARRRNLQKERTVTAQKKWV